METVCCLNIIGGMRGRAMVDMMWLDVPCGYDGMVSLGFDFDVGVHFQDGTISARLFAVPCAGGTSGWRE